MRVWACRALWGSGSIRSSLLQVRFGLFLVVEFVPHPWLVLLAVVLTTTWCELMADPQLFDIRRMVISRDHKIMAIGSLFLGGFIGRALLDKIGSAGTLGTGAGIRLVISAWWLFVPEKKAKK